ncbi:MAG: M24 family metallopeptidase [Candidatus Helarchaeota archaeon]
MEKFENLLKKIPFPIKLTASKFVNLSFRARTEKHVERVRKLCRIQLRALDLLQERLQAGITEIEVKNFLKKEVKKSGTHLGCPILVAFGLNTANVHAFATDNPLKENDIILIDFGLKFSLIDTVGNDITRTYFHGTPTKKQLEIYKIVEIAQKNAIERVKAGRTTFEVDNAARSFIKAHGFDFPHGVGHGIGRYIHAPPFLDQNNWYELKENDIITIEPGIYVPGEFGVRIEDVLLVTRDGFEILSRSR